MSHYSDADNKQLTRIADSLEQILDVLQDVFEKHEVKGVYVDFVGKENDPIDAPLPPPVLTATERNALKEEPKNE